jgi:hypothetical protein
MDLPSWMSSHYPVHEVQEFTSATAAVVACHDHAGSHIQSCEQGGRTVSFVLVAETRQGLSVGQP